MDLDNNAAAPSDGALSVSEAARVLANSRNAKQAPPEAAPEPERDEFAAYGDEDTAESFAPDEGVDAAPDDSQPSGDDTVDAEPAEPPSLEPPRSWTKQAKEHFAGLPPETQQFLLDQDRSRELEVRKSQNEAAELRRQHDARMQAAEQQRQQYGEMLERARNAVLGDHLEKFGDIRTFSDLQRLAIEDPDRFQLFQISERRINATQQEWEAAQRQQVEQTQQRWNAFASEQDKLLRERVPEYADPAKASQEVTQIRGYLTTEIGLSPDELDALWDGRDGISLRDHRARLIIRDAMRYRAAQKAVKAAPSKPVPPVQRPGTAPTRNAAASEIQALERAFQQNPTAKNGAALAAARRRAAARPRQ